MPKAHLNLTDEQKIITLEQLKGSRVSVVVTNKTGPRAGKKVLEYRNEKAYTIHFEGPFERRRRGYFNGWYWDNVVNPLPIPSM